MAELREFTARLGATLSGAEDGLDRIRAMEELRGALAAAQAVESATLVAERRIAAEVEIATVPRPGVGSRRRLELAERQTVAEIGKARRISPHQAGRFVRWACAARSETPAKFGLLAAGSLSERRAVTVFEVAAPLTPEQRRQVDAELAPELPGWGDAKVDTETRAAVYRADPAGAVHRAAYAASQRRATTRPAPDTMAFLNVLAPVAQVVACRAALEQAATHATAAGDPRSRGALMADTLVERVTGQALAAEVPLAVQLVITDQTLRGGDEPAHLADGTPIPAPQAREMVTGETEAHRSIRRLFTDPAGRLVTAETTAREFTPAMAEPVRLRDQICTTPWCDAPIRHIDHHDPHTHGGPTSLTNARGTCQWCNQTKADQVPEPTPPDPPAPAGSSPPRRRKPPPHPTRTACPPQPAFRPHPAIERGCRTPTAPLRDAAVAAARQADGAGSNSTHSSR